MDEFAARLLMLLFEDDGMSINKARKQLDVSMSELMRLLVWLGPESQLGGLALVERQRRGLRDCLFLTSAGREVARETQRV